MRTDDLLLRVECYVAVRKALGYAVRSEEKLLKDFIQFLELNRASSPIRAQTAIEWACAPAPGRGPSGEASRLKVVRRFLSHLQAFEFETEVPSPGVLPAFRRPLPYLYSSDEIAALMKEASDLGQRLAQWPITYLLHSAIVYLSAFVCALVSYDYRCRRAHDRLLPIEGASMRFHSLHDPIDIVKVLPYKSTDSWVLCYRLVSSVGGLITGLGSFNRNVIDERGCDVRYFVSKYEGNIAVHDLWCVRISHGYTGESLRAEGCLERCQVSGSFGKGPLVK